MKAFFTTYEPPLTLLVSRPGMKVDACGRGLAPFRSAFAEMASHDDRGSRRHSGALIYRAAQSVHPSSGAV